MGGWNEPVGSSDCFVDDISFSAFRDGMPSQDGVPTETGILVAVTTARPSTVHVF
jgi:hypothetical protein